MFSYLQAVVKTKKKNNLLGSYIFSGAINATLIALLILPSTTFMLNLQLTLILLELILSVVSLLANLFIGESILAEISKKKYSTLFAMVQLYTYYSKYQLFIKSYSVLSAILVAVTMISVGWVAQAVVYILTIALAVTILYNFIEELPQFVDRLDLNESDIKV